MDKNDKIASEDLEFMDRGESKNPVLIKVNRLAEEVKQFVKEIDGSFPSQHLLEIRSHKSLLYRCVDFKVIASSHGLDDSSIKGFYIIFIDNTQRTYTNLRISVENTATLFSLNLKLEFQEEINRRTKRQIDDLYRTIEELQKQLKKRSWWS